MTDPDFLQVPPMRVLETARLRLRTVRVADAAAVLPIITDETTMLYTSGVVADDVEVAERWLSARVLGKDVLNFVITLKHVDDVDGGSADGVGGGGGKEQIVGMMGSYHWPEIGYLMHPGMFFVRSLHCFTCSMFGRSVAKYTLLTYTKLTTSPSPRRQRLRHRSPARLPRRLLRPRALANKHNNPRRSRFRLRASRNRRGEHR